MHSLFWAYNWKIILLMKILICWAIGLISYIYMYFTLQFGVHHSAPYIYTCIILPLQVPSFYMTPILSRYHQYKCRVHASINSTIASINYTICISNQNGGSSTDKWPSYSAVYHANPSRTFWSYILPKPLGVLTQYLDVNSSNVGIHSMFWPKMKSTTMNLWFPKHVFSYRYFKS